jgi:hypothetical protein
MCSREQTHTAAGYFIAERPDLELSQWHRWASTQGSTPILAEAALMACSTDYVLLWPVLVELKRRHPGG